MSKLLRQIGIWDEKFNLLKVADLIKLKVIQKPMDGNHGEVHPKGEDFVETGIPFVMASDIKAGAVDYGSCKYITKKQADNLRKGFAKNDDVLVTHKATIGRTAIAQYSLTPYIMLTPQVTYYRVLDRESLDIRYLRQYFESSLFQQTIKLWAGSGSTRAYLGITAQHNLPVIYPPFFIQQKIAAILSAYDDLIENNKRRIVLLEKMAEEIYREWFVRFRFPGYQTAEFEKGVPKGWRREKLENLCNLIKRGISPSYNEESTRLVVNQKCIRGGQINLSEARLHDSRVSEEKYIQYCDALINSTGVGTLGRVSIVEFKPDHLTVDSHVTICRANPEKVDPPYLSATVSKLQQYFEFMAAGSTGQVELNKSLIEGIKILVPTESIQIKYRRLVVPIFKQKQSLFAEIESLTKTKKLLLPRLISGKLSVEDLEIQFPPSMQEEDAA